MEDISKISDALLDLENGLSTLQDAVNQIEQAKETAVLAADTTIQIQNSVDILVKRVIHLVNEFQNLDITSKMKNIESSLGTIVLGLQKTTHSFDTLQAGLEQITHSIDSLDAAMSEKLMQQTVDLENGLKARTNQLAERIERESKSILNLTLAKIDSNFAKHKNFQIAQLIISIVTILLVIFFFFR